MKKEEIEQKTWITHLQNHLESCRQALEDIEKLEEKNKFNPDALVLLQQLWKMMEEIQRGADHIYEEIVSIPLSTMCSVNRLQLTKEQFYLTRAAGINLFTAKGLGISPVDDFEVFKNCMYEDSESIDFMDPNETPDTETEDKKTGKSFIRYRLARSPEETCLENYRPEQISFFEKHRPDVLTRAQKTEKKQLISTETSHTNNS